MAVLKNVIKLIFMNRFLIVKFQAIIKQVANKLDISTILKEALNKYSIRCYNIAKISISEGLKLYREAFGKQKDDQSAKMHWLSNEKRIYLWFCLIYEKVIQKQIKNFVSEDWNNLSLIFPGKQPDFLQYQAKNIVPFPRNSNWTPQEDQHLTSLVEQRILQIRKYGIGKWNEIAKDMFFSNNKTILRKPKQCRQRWLNYLDSKKTRGQWDETEDQIIVDFVKKNGQKWSKIVRILGNQRTQHMVKNRYFSLLRKEKKDKRQRKNEREIIDQLNNVQNISKKEIKQQLISKLQDQKLIKQQQGDKESYVKNNLQKEKHSEEKVQYNFTGQNTWYNPMLPNLMYWNYQSENAFSFYPIQGVYNSQFSPYTNNCYFGNTLEQFHRPN